MRHARIIVAALLLVAGHANAQTATGRQTVSNASSLPATARDVDGTNISRTVKDRFEHLVDHTTGWLNVKSAPYSCAGNGISDDTACLQAAFDASYVSRQGVTAVYVPAGRYKITAPLRVSNVQRFRLYGSGRGSTVFLASGALASVFDLNGVQLSTFDGFEINSATGTDTFDKGIYWYWSGVGGTFSSTITSFSNIAIFGKFKTGISVGSDVSLNRSFDESMSSWDHVAVYGSPVVGGPTDPTWWQVGIQVGSGKAANNLIHTFTDTQVIGFKWGVYIASGEAAFHGGNCQSNQIDWYVVNPASRYLRVAGFRSESSQRMIYAPGGTGNAANVTFEDFEWNANAINADGRFIYWGGYPGSLSLRSIGVSVTTVGIEPRIYFVGGGGYHGTLLVDGMTITGGKEATWLDVPGGGTSYEVQHRGVTFLDSTTMLPTAYLDGLNLVGIPSKLGFGLGGVGNGVGPKYGSVDAWIVRSGVAPGAGFGGALDLVAPSGIRPLGNTATYPGTPGPRWDTGSAIPISTGGQIPRNVGDIRYNTAPAELGAAASKYIIVGWICTGAGDPGTWMQMRTLTGN